MSRNDDIRKYVNDSEDDGEFHFVTVAEEESVVCCVPCGINSDRVHADLFCRDDLADFEFLRPHPP